MPMKKKAIWAAVQSGQIKFFTSNPDGNVQGLQGMRKFHVTGDCGVVDDNGSNILEGTSDTTGADDGGSSLSAGDQTSGQTQQEQSQSGTPTA